MARFPFRFRAARLPSSLTMTMFLFRGFLYFVHGAVGFVLLVVVSPFYSFGGVKRWPCLVSCLRVFKRPQWVLGSSMPPTSRAYRPFSHNQPASQRWHSSLSQVAYGTMLFRIGDPLNLPPSQLSVGHSPWSSSSQQCWSSPRQSPS